jgi:tRNA(Arg) A34 adenosine deaminase TadA
MVNLASSPVTQKDRYILDHALKLARPLVPVAGARVAAILDVNDYQFYGFNSKKTHPLMIKWGKNPKAICMHAEIDAIRNCLKRFHPDYLSRNFSTMYVARARADGSSGLAKPCEGCRRALIAFDVKKVVWTE